VSPTLTSLPAPGQFETIEQAQEARALAQAAARRRTLLVWSSPVVAVFLLAAIYLLTITTVVIVGERSYASQSYATATRQFTWLQNVNALERWKPYYNAGTARYAGGAFFPASQELEQALEIVPKGTDGQRGADECLVAMNLSLAYEGLGDQAALAADPAMAISYYDQALAQLEGCATGSGGDSEQESQAQESQERQEGKEGEQQQEQESQQGGGPTDPSDPSQDPSDPADDPADPSDDPTGSDPAPTDPTEEQTGASEDPDMTDEEREVAERNAEAEAERQQQEQESQGGDGGGQGW
jgi:tetratricopeptide (TPR) repeat protein